MPAKNQNSLLIEYGNVYIGLTTDSLVDLGAVRNVIFTASSVKNKIESDNRGTIVNKQRLAGQISFDWLEPGNPAHIELMFKGAVIKTNVAGSEVVGATQPIAAGFVYEEPIELDGQNADGSKPTVTGVSGATDGALTEGDDYVLTKNAAGLWQIHFKSGTNLTTTAQIITVTSTYTPAVSTKITGGDSLTSDSLVVRVIGPSADDENKTRQIDLDAATAASDLILSFVDTENSGDVGVMPVTMENNKGANWHYTDSINV